jgi:hypothetical protein
VATAIGQYLYFDMPRLFDEFLNIKFWFSEGRLGLSLGCQERIYE